MPKRARINFHYTGGAIGTATWNDNSAAEWNAAKSFRLAITGISVVDGTRLAVTCTSHGWGSGYPYFYFDGVGGMTEINGVVGYRSVGGDTNTLYVTVASTSGLSSYTSGGYLYPAQVWYPASSYTSLRDDTDGTVTGWRLHGVLATTYEYSSTQGANSTGSGAADWIDDAKAALHYWGAAGAGSGYTWLLSGLDNTKTYTIEYFGSRAATDATGRPCRLTVGATSSDLNTTTTVARDGAADATGNKTHVASVTGISPSNGAIQFSISEQNGTDFTYLNALRITEAAGASAVKGRSLLLGVG